MIYDEEYMIDDLHAAFIKDLDAEIDCINTEKGAVAGDALFLDYIPATSYVFESVDLKLLNFKGPFILYGLLDSPVSSANIDSYVIGTTLTFQVGMFDKGEKQRSNLLRRLLRYRRALSQVMLKNPDVFRGYAKPLVKRLKPDSLPLDNKHVILKSGIDVTASSSAS